MPRFRGKWGRVAQAGREREEVLVAWRGLVVGFCGCIERAAYEEEGCH